MFCANFVLAVIYRLKFEQPTSESETNSGSEESDAEKPVVEFYDSDPELPLLARMDHGYPVHSLIVYLQMICRKTVYVKSSLLVSLRMQCFKLILIVWLLKILKQMIWLATGTRRTYFRFTQTNAVRYATGVPNSSEHFLLTGRYYVHKTYNRFHRIICDIKGRLYPIHVPLASGYYTWYRIPLRFR